MRRLSLVLLILVTYTSVGCTAEEVTKELSTNVLSISRQNCVRVLVGDRPVGTGFFISRSHVATCSHVITAKVDIDPKQNKFDWTAYEEIFVQCASGEKIEATCVSIPTKQNMSPLKYDFAVLKLKKKPRIEGVVLPFFTWGDAPTIGSDVYFSGYPLGAPAMLTHKGMVSGIAANQDVVCVQAPINKGNSGSALLNAEGEILGIISMREGGISRELQRLHDHISKTESRGSISMLGVNALQSTKEIIDVLNRHISTGIGYAITNKHLTAYLQKNKILEDEQ
jgi:S1-C subfamily serine protease